MGHTLRNDALCLAQLLGHLAASRHRGGSREKVVTRQGNGFSDFGEDRGPLSPAESLKEEGESVMERTMTPHQTSAALLLSISLNKVGSKVQ